MGAYLSEPVTEKISKDEHSEYVSYGASSMQGWRVSQEDSHNCIIDFDADSSFFAVYDGHGGAEVAQYCSMNLPDCVRSMADYKQGKFAQALEKAFMEFDASLIKPEVLMELKQIAGLPNGSDEDESVEDARMLHEEASLPLDEVLARYETSAVKKVAPHVSDYEKPKSPMLRGKKCNIPEDQNGLPGSSKGTKTCSKDTSKNELPSVNGEVDAKSEEGISEEKTRKEEKTKKEDGSGDKNESSETKSESSKTPASSSKAEKDSSKVGRSSSKAEEENEIQNDETKVKEEGKGSSLEEKESSLGGKENSKNVKDSSKSKKDSSVTDKDSSKNKDNSETDKDGSKSKKESSVTDKDISQSKKGSSVTDKKDSSKSKKESSVTDKESSKNDLVQPGCSSSGGSKKKRKEGGSFASKKSSSDEDDSEEDDEEYSAEQDSSSDEAVAGSEDEDEEEEEDDSEDEDEEESEDSEDDDDDDDEKMCGMPRTNAFEEPGVDSGCTSLVALLKGNQLYVANAGDSRCVVSRGGKAINLSFDHKPEDDIESERIVKAGGRVTSDGRVNGGLNLSRAIGDHAYKRNSDLSPQEQMITALPDIQTLVIDPKEDQFMILACDGIWNHISSQDVVDFINERINSKEKLSSICEELFDHCLAPHTLGDGTGCDNMTAIIVKFHNTKKQSSKRQNEPSNNSEEETSDSKKLKMDGSSE